MTELLQKNRPLRRISAVFVASDIQALGVLEVASEMGIRVPDDLAIVGFDDIELAQHVQLTTMRQPMYDMGLLALEKLMTRIKDTETAPTLTTFMPELIIRKSCGAVPAKAVQMGTQKRIELEESGA